MRVMLSEIDFERFVSKITEANNKKGGGGEAERGRRDTIDGFDLSSQNFLTRGGYFLFPLFSLLFTSRAIIIYS